ncbi:hypothetical protein FHY02_004426 [Sphingomonas sp. BK069]|nr:hypothetical protein [Sphingomonas sp. BK069]
MSPGAIIKAPITRLPAFLGFILAPYLYFTGASYESARLDEYGLTNAGFASSTSDRIFSGFNLLLANVLPRLVEILAYSVGATVIAGACSWSLLTSKNTKIVRLRSRLTRARSAMFDHVSDLGIVFSPFAAIIAMMLFLTLLLGWLKLMDLGRRSGISDAQHHLRRIQECVRSAGKVAGCTRLLVRFDGKRSEQIVAAVVAADSSHIAISNGRYVRLIETNQLIAMQIRNLKLK